MKKSRLLFLLSVVCISIISCKKESSTTKSILWKFSKMVNINGNNTINLYQKKGVQWRILQFTQDDYTTFNFKDSIAVTPGNLAMPIDNMNAYMCPNKLFNPVEGLIYFNFRILVEIGAPPVFNKSRSIDTDFPNIPTIYKNLDMFSGVTFSYEKTYDNNPKTATYIFYDFQNQKYLYYGIKTGGTDVILEKSLPDICPTCNTINWKGIDAVTNSDGNSDDGDFYYFFDYDAEKTIILRRTDKNTNSPSFVYIQTTDFNSFFKGKYGTSDEGNPFDFSK